MSKFKFKSARVSIVDKKEFDYIDAYGERLATFTLRYLDQDNPEIKAIFLELGSKNASNKSTVSDEIAIRAMVKACILGWDMQDEDGKAIPYSVDTAMEFFMMKDEGGDQPNLRVFVDLSRYFQNEANFVQPKDIAKNS
jgi:hypothetical protein